VASTTENEQKHYDKVQKPGWVLLFLVHLQLNE